MAAEMSTLVNDANTHPLFVYSAFLFSCDREGVDGHARDGVRRLAQ